MEGVQFCYSVSQLPSEFARTKLQFGILVTASQFVLCDSSERLNYLPAMQRVTEDMIHFHHHLNNAHLSISFILSILSFNLPSMFTQTHKRERLRRCQYRIQCVYQSPDELHAQTENCRFLSEQTFIFLFNFEKLQINHHKGEFALT